MDETRSRVLADIRKSLKRSGPLPDSVREGLDARVRAARPNLQPLYEGPVVERFVQKIQAVSGMVTRVEDQSGIARAVEAHVEKWALPFEIVVAPDPKLGAIPWSNRFAVERRAAVGADRVSVTGSFAGVGETGSLVLLSSPVSPTTLNFLPEDHLVVLEESRIVRYLEDVWTLMREEVGHIPRTVNLITGPSKTGDVEQIIQEGAHGPRRLHVILLSEQG